MPFRSTPFWSKWPKWSALKFEGFRMVIYEVNLEIQQDIFNDFYHWLIPHIKEILKFPGFQKAEIGFIEHPEQQNEKRQGIRVSYVVDSSENLNTYLTQHAANMRADTINRFGNAFTASRRIIKDPIVVEV